MRTLVTWLKSTCFNTPIHMKTQCFQTNWDAALFEKGKAWEAGSGKESIGINPKFYLHKREKRRLRCATKDQSK